MTEAVAERLQDLHCRLISLYILMEADSLSWQKNKPFFEKERCSFIIQMWWLYMQGLHKYIIHIPQYYLCVEVHNVQEKLNLQLLMELLEILKEEIRSRQNIANKISFCNLAIILLYSERSSLQPVH